MQSDFEKKYISLFSKRHLFLWIGSVAYKVTEKLYTYENWKKTRILKIHPKLNNNTVYMYVYKFKIIKYFYNGFLFKNCASWRWKKWEIPRRIPKYLCYIIRYISGQTDKLRVLQSYFRKLTRLTFRTGINPISDMTVSLCWLKVSIIG